MIDEIKALRVENAELKQMIQATRKAGKEATDHETEMLVRMQNLDKALAAARRECEGLLGAAHDSFGAIEDEARLAIDGGGDSPSKAVRTIRGIALSARAALAAPGAGEEGK